MQNNSIINTFNAKKFNAFNKNNAKLQDKAIAEKVCKMLVNYKWSIAHLEELDAELANNARAQFDKLAKMYNVKIAPEKVAKQK
ncbi:MAG: hypothetical protein NC218_04090 [Acetobacter sp.]|nr:hypothetical protein [Acetobacter sp.]